MLERLSPLTQLRARLDPANVARDVLARANSNSSHNTYLWLSEEHLGAQAAALTSNSVRPPLWGVPVSLKDCFDLAGVPTSCGSRFHAGLGPAEQDSAMAAALRRAGALITGKTHLHPLAYGITGENPEYGDCLQPRDASLLTGGSSSGAAASVQEGSALVAIGTDTGGSIRVPAALCGLAGYRASLTLPEQCWPEAWRGGAHLAPSFDTVGFLLRDPRDLAPVASALFSVPLGEPPVAPRIGCVSEAFLEGCEPEVLLAFRAWKQQLQDGGARIGEIDTSNWAHTPEIFAGIQAHEAAQLHVGRYDRFEPAIRDRLRWGASLTDAEVAELRSRRQAFVRGLCELFPSHDFLMLPCAPVSQLLAGADHSSARPRILRYTTPFSLAGLPAVSLPGETLGAPRGTGMQLAAASGEDAALLAYAAAVGDRIAARR